MPFRAPYDAIYRKVILPSLEELDVAGIRADDIFAAGDVVGQIVTAIVDSEFVVAEISELNANVYYEIGLAHAFKKPTILLSRSADTIPFDLRTGRCIIYDVDNPEWGRELGKQIQLSVQETQENPLRALPLAVSSSARKADLAEAGDGSGSIEHRSRQLDQMSQAVARLIPGLPPMDTGVHPESTSLRATAETLMNSGMAREEVIQYLVRAGATTPWAEYTVDGLRPKG